MPDRLVDVVDDKKSAVIHTVPVTIADHLAPNDEDFERKAAEAAAFVPLVPEHELENLSTKLHVDRGGPLQPFGDPHELECGTREGIEQIIREMAYQMWEVEGRLYAERHWHSCRVNDLRARAYRLWKLEGCPEHKADEHWQCAADF